MDSKTESKKSHTGEDVEVLAASYEDGKPEVIDRWMDKMRDRKEMIDYLKTADRYWHAEEGFGSEKRKNPA